jgi:hypothetical protein
MAVTVPEKLQELDVVAIVVDVPEEGLVRGHVGTVLEIDDQKGLCLVEFSDNDGETFAIPALRPDQLMRLVHQRLQRAG